MIDDTKAQYYLYEKDNKPCCIKCAIDARGIEEKADITILHHGSETNRSGVPIECSSCHKQIPSAQSETSP